MSERNDARYDLHGRAWKGRHEGHADVLRGPGYLYRPGHILVEDDQEYTAGVVAHLEGLVGATRHDGLHERIEHAGLPIKAFQVPDHVDIPALVERLRVHEHGEPVPNVGPNHVYCGAYEIDGGGDPEPPRAAPPGVEVPSTEPDAGPPRIAILDTGFDRMVKHLHPGLYERLAAEGEENPFGEDGLLEHEAGHGTFVAGIIMKLAPELRIRQVRALDPAGVGDDVLVAHRLATANAAVVNLSFGGYTHGGRPPVALATALAQLNDKVAVVAAAGNHGSPEPFWPAAFKRVIAVGAVDTTNGTPVRADFSNYGHWVDVYAPGVKVLSTHLRGFYEEPGRHLEHLKGWAHWSGTSFAAPQVAAEIASLVRAGLTARQAAYQVLASAAWHPGIGPVLLPSAA
jgi:subtilisin family serine protease